MLSESETESKQKIKRNKARFHCLFAFRWIPNAKTWNTQFKIWNTQLSQKEVGKYPIASNPYLELWTLLFSLRFSWNFHYNVCRTKKLGMKHTNLGSFFAHFLIGKGPIYCPKSGLEKSQTMDPKYSFIIYNKGTALYFVLILITALL